MSVQTEFFIGKITRLKRGNMDIYNQILKDLFDKKISWGKVKELNDKKLLELSKELKIAINLKEFNFEIEDLAKTIQEGLSGDAYQAITKFECKMRNCNNQEDWKNSNTPDICFDCAKDMAKYLIENKNKLNFTKENINLKDLTSAIQKSRSGVGGATITRFNCNFCDKEENWRKTATPEFCSDCAEKIAKNIKRELF